MSLYKISQKNKLVLLFTMTYMISYMTRINYSAIISEMEYATGMSRSLLSMALTGSAVTYGIGQIISGVCGDKFSPKRLVCFGLVTTVLMNLLIPLCNGPYQMLVVWCVNGFAQAFMWPPIVKLMTTLLTDEEYKKASVTVSWGSSFGSIAIYLICPLLIALSGWRTVFIFSAVCGAVVIFIWNRNCPDIEKEHKVLVRNAAEKKKNMLFTPLMIFIMLAIVLQGMLRDGVTTWMPSYIAETYHLSSAVSILTGVVLPVFSIFCFQAAAILYRKKFQNPLLCAGVIFGAGVIASLALFIVSGKNAAFSVLFSALLTGCMHGVNLVLICMIPPFFQENGNVSTVSGILNSCTYVGSAISTYGIALISEIFSWRFTLLIWGIIAVLGTITCFACIRPWNKEIGGKR